MTARVLILCTRNSARSVLSEGILNHWARSLDKDVQAHSAGSTPSGHINRFAIEVLRDAGVETAGFRSKSWDEFTTSVSVPLCPSSSRCATVPTRKPAHVFFGAHGQPVKVHWRYPDPSLTQGSAEDKRRAFELTRQAVGNCMLQMLHLPIASMDRSALQDALGEIARS